MALTAGQGLAEGPDSAYPVYDTINRHPASIREEFPDWVRGVVDKGVSSTIFNIVIRLNRRGADTTAILYPSRTSGSL
jgi:hypothetical protein